MSGERPARGEWWTVCAAGHVHWGADGGAGLLLRHLPAKGEPTYLLCQRSRWVDEGGRWGIPGGAIRDGESPETAAQRETVEEVGQLPHYRRTGIEPQDCGGGWLFHVISADVDREFDAYCGQETDTTGWFAAEPMQSLPLHPGLRRWLEEHRFLRPAPSTPAGSPPSAAG
jgi:8-oxo-dGTP diphosphatase